MIPGAQAVICFRRDVVVTGEGALKLQRVHGQIGQQVLSQPSVSIVVHTQWLRSCHGGAATRRETLASPTESLLDSHDRCVPKTPNPQ